MSKKSTKLEALNDIFIENGISRDDIPVHDNLIRILSMLDINTVKEALNSKGKFPEK